MKPRYSVSIVWSDADQAYVARVPALRGCISHGDTDEQAVVNIVEAMEGFLEMMRDHGDLIPELDLAAEDVIRPESKPLESQR